MKYFLLILIDAGADVNKQEDSGETALCTACHNGNYKCVNLLIQVGADTIITDSAGDDAAGFAALKGNSKCLSLLVTHGAELRWER